MITSPNSPSKVFDKYFNVIAHTDELLIIQTHSGVSSETQSLSQTKEETGKTPQESENYGHFNLGLHVSDDSKKVLLNRAKLLCLMNKYLAVSTPLNLLNNFGSKNPQPDLAQPNVESIHWLNQIHSNKVHRIDSLSTMSGVSMTAPSADALITDKPSTALAIMTADCVPIVIYDKLSKQVATIHAGWQGLANGVIAKTYAEMFSKETNLDKLNQQNSSLKDNSVNHRNELADSSVQAWIGACISQPCYEVSIDVVDKLLSGCKTMGMDPKLVAKRVVGVHQNPDKAWLDLPALAALQLQIKGVKVHTYSDVQVGASQLTHSDNLENKKVNQFTTTQEVSSKEAASQEAVSQEQPSKHFAFACSYMDNRYYSYRRMTHLGQKHTGRMAMIAVRLK